MGGCQGVEWAGGRGVSMEGRGGGGGKGKSGIGNSGKGMNRRRQETGTGAGGPGAAGTRGSTRMEGRTRRSWLAKARPGFARGVALLVRMVARALIPHERTNPLTHSGAPAAPVGSSRRAPPVPRSIVTVGQGCPVLYLGWLVQGWGDGVRDVRFVAVAEDSCPLGKARARPGECWARCPLAARRSGPRASSPAQSAVPPSPQRRTVR